jgi:hypothetical protein
VYESIPRSVIITLGRKLYKLPEVGVKYGRRRSTLNNVCKPRKGEVLSSKALSPKALVIVQGP